MSFSITPDMHWRWGISKELAFPIADLPLTALILEQDENDVQVARELLTQSPGTPPLRLVWERSLYDGLDRLLIESFDLVLLSLGLPTGFDILAYERLRVSDPSVPVIILCTPTGESTAVEAVRRGARDYIVKWRWDSRSAALGLTSFAAASRLHAAWAQATGAGSELVARSADLTKGRNQIRAQIRCMSGIVTSLERSRLSSRQRHQLGLLHGSVKLLQGLAEGLESADSADVIPHPAERSSQRILGALAEL